MGCDVHVHLEVKIKGKWRHWSAPYVSRNYQLFARMAGVRNATGEYHVEPIARPRGLPADATFETKFDHNHMGVDAHSASWLSGAEVEALGEWWEKKKLERDPKGFFSFEHHVIGYLMGNGWNVARYPGDAPVGVTDARMIFWFDN